MNKHQVHQRFRRSARLGDEKASDEALIGFSLHATGRNVIDRMASAAAASDRSFTWTGPYGSGKSSLAIYLAAILGPNGPGRDSAEALAGSRVLQRWRKALPASNDGWLVVEVVGSRARLDEEIDRSLEQAVVAKWGARQRKKLLASKNIEDRLVAASAKASAEGDGLLLIIDELGKSLEHFAQTGTDPYMFQQIAEAFSRAESRCLLVGILHQSFAEYAGNLDSRSRDEWAKIQGRFVDIPFSVSLRESLALIGEAIQGPVPPAARTKAADLAKIVDAGAQLELARLLEKCWPLEPATALLLAATSRERFSQNERSVFSFLSSMEPCGFRDFLESNSAHSYGIERFWDYLQLNLEPSIMSSGLSHRWAMAAETVERARKLCADDAVATVKTVALVELFGRAYQINCSPKLLTALFGERAAAIAQDLAEKSVLIYRRHADTWGLFAGSDIDIEGEVEKVRAQLSKDVRVLEEVIGGQSPVVAKRHLHQTGTLRWFEPRLVAASRLSEVAARWNASGGESGAFLLALPDADETTEDMQSICAEVSEKALANGNALAIGVSHASGQIIPLAEELVALQKLPSILPALEGDAVARRELFGLIDAARLALRGSVRRALESATWYLVGEPTSASLFSELSSVASDLSDRVFSDAPPLFNELVNRDRPTSNAVAAQRVLMHRMVQHADKSMLGIEGRPPEAGLYLSLLARAPGQLHVKASSGAMQFQVPTRRHPFSPLWQSADALFLESKEDPIPFGDLYEIWRKPPFGLRAGVMPILALSYFLSKEEEFGVYMDGLFTPQIDDFFVDRLLQRPAEVALRRFRIAGVRRDALLAISNAIGSPGTASDVTPLSVAKPLVSFAHRLHPWVKRTSRLRANTRKVRDVLLRASDPYSLLYKNLPEAFGVGGHNNSKAQWNSIGAELELAVGELRDAYDSMLEGFAATLWDALGNTPELLEKRCARVIGKGGDLRLDAFARRLAAAAKSSTDLEGLASLVANKPPRDWSDSDIERALVETVELAQRFKRIEKYALAREPNDPDALTISAVVGSREGHTEVDWSLVLDKSGKKKADSAADALFKVLEAREMSDEQRLAAVARLLDRLERSRLSDLPEGTTSLRPSKSVQ